jgi:hypothetical protein
VPGWPIRSLVAEDRSTTGVRDQTGPEPAFGLCWVRAPSETGGPRRAQAVTTGTAKPQVTAPERPGPRPLEHAEAASNPSSSCSRGCSRDLSEAHETGRNGAQWGEANPLLSPQYCGQERTADNGAKTAHNPEGPGAYLGQEAGTARDNSGIERSVVI